MILKQKSLLLSAVLLLSGMSSLVANDTIDEAARKKAKKQNTNIDQKGFLTVIKDGLVSGALNKTLVIGLLAGGIDSQNELTTIRTPLVLFGTIAASTAMQGLEAIKDNSVNTKTIFLENNDRQAKIGLNKEALTFKRVVYTLSIITGNSIASIATYFCGRYAIEAIGKIDIKFELKSSKKTTK